MKPITLNLWILKDHKNVSYLQNFHPGILNRLEEIFFEKPQALQRIYMYELMATQ